MSDSAKHSLRRLFRTLIRPLGLTGCLLSLNSVQAVEVGVGIDGWSLRMPIEFRQPLRIEPSFGYSRQLPNGDPSPSEGSTTSTGLQVEYLNRSGDINWSVGALISRSYSQAHDGPAAARRTSESLSSGVGLVLGAELVVTPNWRIGIENRLIRDTTETRAGDDPTQPQRTGRTTSTSTSTSLVLRYLI